MTEQSTALLQNWLKTIITTPGYLNQKVGRAYHLYGVMPQEVVNDGGGATTQRRLNVYSSGYLARLLECMSADYEVLKKFTGDEVFDGFAKAYLMYHPSTSFTLYDLGKAFPDFLDRTKPKTGDANDFMALPVAIARVERARQQAKRAKGTEDDPIADDVVGVEGILFGTAEIKLPPCLHLLSLEYPIKDFYEAVYNDAPYSMPALQRSYLAVGRKKYRITLTELTFEQYSFLLVCNDAPTIYAAAVKTSQVCKAPLSDVLADACKWLPEFRLKGIIR